MGRLVLVLDFFTRKRPRFSPGLKFHLFYLTNPHLLPLPAPRPSLRPAPRPRPQAPCRRRRRDGSRAWDGPRRGWRSHGLGGAAAAREGRRRGRGRRRRTRGSGKGVHTYCSFKALFRRTTEGLASALRRRVAGGGPPRTSPSSRLRRPRKRRALRPGGLRLAACGGRGFE